MKPTTLLLFLAMTTTCLNSFPQTTGPVRLWPDTIPGSDQPRSADVFSEDHSRMVTRIAQVTDPVVEIFQPADGNPTGTAIVVCPGGGYQILAIDLEGYEVAQWLNSLGITALVLHYRVPGHPGAALMDAQRAIRIARSMKFRQTGIMGFSAGGSLSARAATRFSDQLYAKVDPIDELSAKPDFALLIYPAYLDEGQNKSLTPELKIGMDTPPMFLFGTADDPYGNSALVMAAAMRDKGVPAELHFMPEGGHGYGVRKGNPAAETWPPLAANWLNKRILRSGK